MDWTSWLHRVSCPRMHEWPSNLPYHDRVTNHVLWHHQIDQTFQTNIKNRAGERGYPVQVVVLCRGTFRIPNPIPNPSCLPFNSTDWVSRSKHCMHCTSKKCIKRGMHATHTINFVGFVDTMNVIVVTDRLGRHGRTWEGHKAQVHHFPSQTSLQEQKFDYLGSDRQQTSCLRMNTQWEEDSLVTISMYLL